MRRLTALVAIGFVLATGPAAFGQVIYDNAVTVPAAIAPIGIITGPGGAPGGLDLSQGTSPDTLVGAGVGVGFRLADNFTVPAGEIWTITGANVFAYNTGAVAPSMTQGVLQFWTGMPGTGTVVGGDATTNVLSGNTFTNIVRPNPFTSTETTRRVQEVNLTLGTPLVLNPGTYWIDFGLTTATAAAAFTPPLTVAGVSGANGDAMQFNPTGSVWSSLLDAGSASAKGIPFQLVGSVVPEPTSIALVGVGAVGLALRRWRKKK